MDNYGYKRACVIIHIRICMYIRNDMCIIIIIIISECCLPPCTYEWITNWNCREGNTTIHLHICSRLCTSYTSPFVNSIHQLTIGDLSRDLTMSDGSSSSSLARGALVRPQLVPDDARRELRDSLKEIQLGRAASDHPMVRSCGEQPTRDVSQFLVRSCMKSYDVTWS